MYLVEIGQKLKALRKAKGLTQGQLASLSGVARETISRLENGTCRDLGFKRLVELLQRVDGQIVVQAKATQPADDHVRLAVASVNEASAEDGHDSHLRPDELIRALLTGSIPEGKEPQIRSVLVKMPEQARHSLIRLVNDRASTTGKAEKGAVRLRDKLKV